MKVVGPYELLVRLSSANTGYVYSARVQGAATKILVVKMIKPRLASEVRFQQLLLTEAPAATQFSHRGAVRYLQIAQLDNELVLAMELIRGQPFSAVMERAKSDRRPLARDLIVHILGHVARTLAGAHNSPWCEEEEKGMIHGEVSPQSILIGYDGQVKLLGVGVGRSRLVLPPARSRLPYRAPELFERKRPENYTDVYGLGATLYDALGRTRLYARDSVNETIQAILEARHAPLASVAHDVGPEVADLVDSMIARNPEQRLHAMHEIASVLENAASESSVDARTLLADEMRILFAGEMQESVIEAPVRERTLRPHPTPMSFDPSLPLEPSIVREIRPAADVDDVDSLVDKIVSTAKGRGPMKPLIDAFLDPTPMPIFDHEPSRPGPMQPILTAQPVPPLMPVRKEPTSPGMNLPKTSRTPPRDGHTPTPGLSPLPRSSSSSRVQQPPPKQDSFSRALEEASSQEEVDALVDAIVHASALAKTPVPGPPLKSSDLPRVQSTGDVVGQETFGFRMGHVINGRYRIIEKLGAGGMAVVYKVEHTLLEKCMALKLLRPELSTVPYVVQRFQREARFVSQLDDPRIVRVTDFGRAENGSLFLVMELIEGESLSRKLERVGAMPLQLSLHIAEQVLLALDHAHRQNVIHRDLKPDNIMLLEKEGRTQVKIVDFGIAKLASEAPSGGKPLTQAGMVFGSPRYMSPEQASGETVDYRSDLYAVGVMLYEMLCGKRPFDGTSARAILSAVLMQAPPPLDLKLDDKNRAQAIEHVIVRAMSKDREERYPSAMAFWESLRATM